MKIIIMASRFPYPLEKGDKLRLYHAIRLLSVKHEIHLVYMADNQVGSKQISELESFVTSFLPLEIGWIKSALLTLKSIIQSELPVQVAWKYDQSLVEKISQYVDKIKPDLIFCQLIRMSEYAKHLKYPKILDYMDAFSESMKKRSRVAGLPLKYFYLKEGLMLSDYEKRVKDFFDARSIISLKDKKLMNLDDDQNTVVISNGVNTNYFKNTSKNSPPGYDVGFIGNLSYLPNIHAIEFLHRNIFKHLSHLKFLINGATPADRIKKLHSDGFFVKGWVDDIRTSYEDIAIFVAPIFAGTGQQNKILEAMAMGIPCITTEAVNDSIGAIPDEQICIANTGNQFVDKIIELKENREKARMIGNNGKKFVSEYYTWENHVDKLEKLFEKAIYEFNRKRDRIRQYR